MLIARDGALVGFEPGELAHLKLQGCIATGAHVADELDLAFPPLVKSLLYPVLESQHKFQGSGIQRALGQVAREGGDQKRRTRGSCQSESPRHYSWQNECA